MNKLLELRIVRFALTGGIATTTHISIAFLLIALFKSSTLIANIAGFSCAFGLSYSLQSYFVFRKKTSWQNARRFFLVQFSALIMAQIISYSFAAYSPYWRVLMVVLLIPLITYLIHRVWTYSDDHV